MAQTDIQQLENQLRRWEDRIVQMEADVDNSRIRVSDTFRHDLQDLKHRHREARAQLARMRLEDAESWSRDDLQAGVHRIFDEIGARIDRLFSHAQERRKPH